MVCCWGLKDIIHINRRSSSGICYFNNTENGARKNLREPYIEHLSLQRRKLKLRGRGELAIGRVGLTRSQVSPHPIWC